jgi:hypothetical protein
LAIRFMVLSGVNCCGVPRTEPFQARNDADNGRRS